MGIGWLIAVLSFRLRERQDLYQGLFYHSEAGSILVRDTGKGMVIEEVNDKASELLHRTAPDLAGAPLIMFWSSDFEQDLFLQAQTGRCCPCDGDGIFATGGKFRNGACLRQHSFRKSG